MVLALPLLSYCICPTLVGVSSDRQENPTQAQPADIKGGILTIAGELTKDDHKDRVRQKSPHKAHQVKLVGGRSYALDLLSKDFDGFLRLEDSAGAEVASDDDSGGDLNPRIVFKPSRDATYRVIVTTFAGGTGKYRLTIRDTPDIAAELKNGVLRATGQLHSKDQEARERYFKAYVIKFMPGKAYTIDLESNDFDAFLRLENAQGKILAQDDDGGGDLNARIVFSPTKEDTYRIIVTTFEPGETGRYTLSVRQK
jgi:hypothetical protein